MLSVGYLTVIYHSVGRVSDTASFDAKQFTDLIETYLCKGAVEWVSSQGYQI